MDGQNVDKRIVWQKYWFMYGTIGKVCSKAKRRNFNKQFVKRSIKMLLIESISAITSWEDYEYQRHVALDIALTSILDLLLKKIVAQ